MIRTPFQSRSGVDAVFAVGWVAVLFAGWAFIIAPAQSSEARKAADLSQLSELRTKSLELAQAAQAQRDRLAKLESELKRNPLQLAGVGALNQRIADLTALADQVSAATSVGLKIEQITPGAPVAGPRYTAVPIRLSGIATYVGAQVMLERLHERFPDTGVTAFSLASTQEGAATASFTLELMWYAAPAGATARNGQANRADRAAEPSRPAQ